MIKMIVLVLYLLLFINIEAQFTNQSVESPESYKRSYPCSEENHIVLIPGLLTSGAVNRVCISRFHTDGTSQLTLHLRTSNQKTSTFYKEFEAGDGGCIDIQVPHQPNTKADINISLRYPEYSCSWEKQATVRIASGRLLFLQTEKPRYRPGETLRWRILALKADFTPGHHEIEEVWLEGPSGLLGESVRVAQWNHIRTRLGLTQMQYKFEGDVVAGKWIVRASLDGGTQGVAEFWVGDYKLPPFQLSVRHMPQILKTSERLHWTVCVRYPWSESVEGMLVVRLRGGGAGCGGECGGGVRTAVRVTPPRLCVRPAAAAHRVGLNTEHPPDVVIADFSFQEKGTMIWQNTTVVSQVVHEPVALEFLSKHKTVISPGLPYKLKVKATRWDGKPSAIERLKICRSPVNTPAELHDPSDSNPQSDSFTICDEITTDNEGIAKVMFNVQHVERFIFYKFENGDVTSTPQATIKNDTEVTAQPLYLPVKRTGRSHAAFGAISGDNKNPGARVFVPLYLNLKNVRRAITVHFVVITRGGVIHRWGATTQCPIANSPTQVHTAPRNSDCNQILNNMNLTAVNNELVPEAERHLLRVLIPIRLSHQMCPDSHMIAYFYFNGELVSAVKYFEVEDCITNKVELSWQNRQTSPGSFTSLNISTPGPALCALSSIDVASKWLHTHTPSTKDILLEELKKLMATNRNITCLFYDLGNCLLTNDDISLISNNNEVTAAWMASTGVQLKGIYETVQKKFSKQPIPVPLTNADNPAPRTDFFETWLWRIVTIPANGSLIVPTKAPDSITKYETNALCVAKNGIAVSQPTVLQVFREFFIHADMPNKLKRGDITLIQYRIFNYLYTPLSVQINVLSDHHLDILRFFSESACIGPRSSIARRTEVLARIAGKGRLSVQVTAVWDTRCDNTTKYVENKTRVSDEVIMAIEIEPEGIPVREEKSTLLCAEGYGEYSVSSANWTWSTVQTVPDTESVTIWAVSDFTGPLIADANSLILFPQGCGEQNMARLATNVLAIMRLDPRSSAAATAKENIARGFHRQLQFIHSSGGFSAFGHSDGMPSTWLTAFSVRYLRKAHQIISPGSQVPAALERAERWLISQQMENGCFRNEGQVFHKELKGGLSNEEIGTANVALTAYVITSLIEGSVNMPPKVLKNSLSCLRALQSLKFKSKTRIYGHALLSYALMRIKSYEEELRKTNDVSLLLDKKRGVLETDEEMRELLELMKVAKRGHGFVWWDTGNLSTSIEATGYALLALSSCPPSLRETNCAQDARGAIRWLSTHRNAAGGFLSTQDTLVALEGLTAWSSLQPPTTTRLKVFAESDGYYAQDFIGPESSRVPIVIKVKPGKNLEVHVEGTGCALIQATRSYNINTTEESEKSLNVQVSVHPDGPFDCDQNKTFCFCASVVQTCVLWFGGFPEMALLEVSLPGGFGADASMLYAQLQEKHTLARRIEMSPNGNRVTIYLGTKDGSPLQDAGHQCFKLHAVGPKAKTRPAYAKIMDYYQPHINDTKIYTIPEDCPSRFVHEPRQLEEKVTNENLYESAVSADGTINIAEDFKFEDLLDGIPPLDDPFYDNLEKLSTNSTKKLDKSDSEDVSNVNNTENIDIDRITLNNTTTEIDNIASIKININVNEENKSPTSRIELKTTDRTVTEAINQDTNNYSDVTLSSENTAFVDKTIEQGNDDDNDPNTITPYHEKFKETSLNIAENQENHEFPTQQTGTEEINIIHLGLRPDHASIQADNHETENPHSNFHVIDSEDDLAVPDGIEGPVPAVVLPPENYVIPSHLQADRPTANNQRRYYQANQQKMYYLEYTPYLFAHSE